MSSTEAAVTRWRKKPVEIEARLFDPGYDYDAACEVITWCGATATEDGCEISTLEGVMTARPGDWIVRGVEGEFYPCRSGIFMATYEPADDAPGEGAARPSDPDTTLTGSDIECVTFALEALAGSVTGDLVPDAPRLLLADPRFQAAAAGLLAKIGRLSETPVYPETGEPLWTPAELQDMVTRAAGAGH